MFVFSLTFIVGATLGLARPWDVVIPIGASLLLALSFVVMKGAVHYSADDDHKIWSHIGIAFAILYVALVSMVYVTWLFVVEPHVLRGESDQVVPFVFASRSFSQTVDGLGYTLMMIAAFFTAPAFSNRGLERWIRWVGIANGLFAIPVFLSYLYSILILGVGWVLTIPAYSLLLILYFWRAGHPVR